MNLEELLNRAGEWLKGTGPEGDVVVSSRVRLARNLNRYPFLTVASPAVRGEIERHVGARLGEGKLPRKLFYWSIEGLSPLDRMFLVERHLISREHAQGEGDRGVALSEDEAVSVMVNEEDHLRLQALRSGFQLDEAYEEVNRLDSALEESLNFAFSPRFGYLTACPTNVGTGMRISVLLHLPGVVLAKQVDKVLQSMQRLNYVVRGLYGEGTSPLGDFYQISNQVTLGKSERDLLEAMKQVIPEVLKFERQWRRKLLEDDRRRVEDRVWRAWGILRNARRMTSEEALELLSALRLGVDLGLVTGISLRTINELFLFIQPAHLQKLEQRILEPEERDAARADYLRRRLEGL